MDKIKAYLTDFRQDHKLKANIYGGGFIFTFAFLTIMNVWTFIGFVKNGEFWSVLFGLGMDEVWVGLWSFIWPLYWYMNYEHWIIYFDL